MKNVGQAVGQASSLPVCRASLPDVCETKTMNQENQNRGARGGADCGWKPLQPAGEDACPTSEIHSPSRYPVQNVFWVSCRADHRAHLMRLQRGLSGSSNRAAGVFKFTMPALKAAMRAW